MSTRAQRPDAAPADANGGASSNGERAGEPTDQIFAQPRKRVDDFVFDGRTAGVFDDMLGRSVPFYAEIQRMTAELAADFATPGSNVYDLGCSTGTTFSLLDPVVDKSVRFVGIDDSPEMLEKARQKLASTTSGRPIDLVRADLHELSKIENASVVMLTLTLQFVRPLHRERLVRTICEGTNQQGCLILVEKLTESDTLFNRLFIKYYYDMKRRHGYSDLEISQKREALENVLIPYRAEENEQLLLAGGYRRVQRFFQWYNFAGVIAVK
jgi:tRNA (cmo5U34)-methyltransferase